MGGDIGVESEEGAGATFTFTTTLGIGCLLNEIAPPQMSQLKDETEKRMKSLRVLVAEDNKVNALVATRMLRNMGINAVVVEDGSKAVAQVVASQFDLVLMVKLASLCSPQHSRSTTSSSEPSSCLINRVCENDKSCRGGPYEREREKDMFLHVWSQ